jgi:methylaspartate ammonia-lyase
MMTSKDLTIIDVLCTAGQAGFYFDDQVAIRHGAVHDGFDYAGEPETKGFKRIRQPGESVSVSLLLSNGAIAFGDCAAVQYSGAGGRDPLFIAEEVIASINTHIRPLLVGASLTSFRDLASLVDGLAVDGEPLHTALRYGVTQALLDGVALSRRVTMAEVIRDEYGLTGPMSTVPIFAQSGEDRYLNVQKMIVREVPVLPHGLINNAAANVGENGEVFLEYMTWVRDQVMSRRTRPEYEPLLHFDCYGTIGQVFGGDVEKIADYMQTLVAAAAPLRLRLEHPLDAGSRDGQILAMANLRSELRRRGIAVELVVDEWCNTLEDIEAFVAGESADVIHVKMPDLGGINNTIEALLFVRSKGLKAYCGGSCNETDRSAQISAHVAMACGADQILAKPGMGVDEGLATVGNEMARVMTLSGIRSSSSDERELTH